MSIPDQEILFSDYFQIEKSTLEEYGTFNISLLSDLPLFIDPFLLFNSPKPEYQRLHHEIIQYLTFLRDKSVSQKVTEGLLKEWYYFKEVKQTWLGFTVSGNGGNGLGKDFASALNANFCRLFAEQEEKQITRGQHLEKLCLVKSGVGRDNISDFTTTLIKEFLLLYTQEFAKKHLKPEQCKVFPVRKVRFNYQTESWEALSYFLPNKGNEYIILVPRDLLAKDDTWINRTDLINSFDLLPPAISDEGLRAQVNNYFIKMLPDAPKENDRKKAAAETISQFPELVDYYIKMKEDRGEEAVASSDEKVAYAESLFLENFTKFATLVATQSDFYSHSAKTVEGTLSRVKAVRKTVEERGGYQLLYNFNGNPVAIEDELNIAYRFLWFSPLALEGVTAKEIIPVEFKLASNRNLNSFLNKKLDKIREAESSEAESPRVSVIAIFCFSALDLSRADSLLQGRENSGLNIIVIDASKSTQQGKAFIMYQETPPTVFVSYSHDYEVWQKKGEDLLTQKKRVRNLVERLRSEGVECVFDQHIESPSEGWPRWMMNKIENASYVLVIATETYDRRFRGKEEPGKGKGAQWEGAVITQELYDANGRNVKFIPVIFENADEQYIPLPLRSTTYYDVSSDEEYDNLYFRLTQQPGYTPNPLGPIRKRPDQQ